MLRNDSSHQLFQPVLYLFLKNCTLSGHFPSANMKLASLFLGMESDCSSEQSNPMHLIQGAWPDEWIGTVYSYGTDSRRLQTMYQKIFNRCWSGETRFLNLFRLRERCLITALEHDWRVEKLPGQNSGDAFANSVESHWSNVSLRMLLCCSTIQSSKRQTMHTSVVHKQSRALRGIMWMCVWKFIVDKEKSGNIEEFSCREYLQLIRWEYLFSIQLNSNESVVFGSARNTAQHWSHQQSIVITSSFYFSIETTLELLTWKMTWPAAAPLFTNKLKESVNTNIPRTEVQMELKFERTLGLKMVQKLVNTVRKQMNSCFPSHARCGIHFLSNSTLPPIKRCK